MQGLEGKGVVITGAASGIGRALALACARRGARLLLADVQLPALEETAALARAASSNGAAAQVHVLRTDTGVERDLHELAAASQGLLGGADLLVNNAGVSLVSSVEKLQTEDAQWIFNINFWGVVHGCRAFLPQLKAKQGAQIVNISSIFAMVSMPTQSMYNASKAAVRAFSDSLREELRAPSDGHPVAVLCVHPGGIRTNIANQARIKDLSLMHQSPEQMKASFNANVRTSPEEAAESILQAVQQGRTRLLIGLDAKLADWMYRLRPARASQWLSGVVAKRQAAAAKKL